MRVVIFGFLLALPLNVFSQDVPFECNSVRIEIEDVAPITSSSQCVIVGTIVGAQVDSATVVLYATEPRPGASAVLWRDEIVELTRGAMRLGPNYRFSLDFERSGQKNFRAEEIGDLATIGTILESGANPIVQMVRRKAGSLHDQIARIADDKTRAKLREKFADALNAALGEDLVALVPSDIRSADVRRLVGTPGVNPRRIRRFILEEVFHPWINRDVNSKWMIRWSSEKDTDDPGAIFRNGRTERVLLEADTLLKSFDSGEKLPKNTPAYGRTLLSLCTDELINEVQQAGQILSFDDIGVYFDLDIREDEAPQNLHGKSQWFTPPSLKVTVSRDHSGIGPRKCTERYVASLTKYMPRLLADQGIIGERLRNLEMLLTVKRALEWIVASADPDEGFLSSVKTEALKNAVPPIMDLSMIFAAGNRIAGIGIKGGVLLESGLSTVERYHYPTGEGSPRPAQVDPPFSVTTVEVGGRTLLRIDISAILGLMDASSIRNQAWIFQKNNASKNVFIAEGREMARRSSSNFFQGD